MDNDDLDEDIERLKIVLQDEDDEEAGSDGELRVLDNIEEEYQSTASRPSTSSDVTASSLPTTSMCTDADEMAIRFDPQTITAETCLAMNRAYQEVLLDTLRQIEMALTENRERQKQLEDSMNTKKAEKTQKDSYTLKDARLLPYFRDKNGQLPPPNPDVAQIEEMEGHKQHVRPKPGWTKLQRKKLIEAIKVDALEQLIRPLMSKQEVMMEKLAKCKNQEEIDAQKARIEEIHAEIRRKQETSGEELLRNVDSDKIDFLKISALTFDNKYDASECESIWRNVLHPVINRDGWIEEEEARLTGLVEKYNMRNWKQIAAELGTNRTPFQCLQHHQKHSAIYDTSEWTGEEDELLKEVVETCTYGAGRIQWFQVAYYVDRRSAAQCRSRWLAINPNRNTGRWTQEEDLQLLSAVQALGGELRNWSKVQEHVPTRTAAQCRERFVHGFNETLVNRPWTYEEDKRLLQMVNEQGNQWPEIAVHFMGRNDNACAARYKRLIKWQQLMDQFKAQPRKVQKNLLHPSFEFGIKGEFEKKKGLVGRSFKPGREFGFIPKPRKSEIQVLKDMAKGLLTPSITGEDDDVQPTRPDIKIKQEPIDADEINEREQLEEEKRQREEEEEEDDETSSRKKKLQKLLDVFLSTYNITMLDYHKMWLDEMNGDLVVPRPPPVKNYLSRSQNLLWKGTNKLSDVVVTQIDKYVKCMADNGEASTDIDLYDQIASSIQGASADEKKRLIIGMFNGKNPSQLSVRELLQISRKLRDIKREKKDKEEPEPWEVEGSDEEEADGTSSSESEVVEVSDEEKDVKPKRPKTTREKERLMNLAKTNKLHFTINREIKDLIQNRMTAHEFYDRGRRKKFFMYPKSILMKYKGLDDERRLNRKSLVLLLKSLDVDAKKAFIKARKSKRQLSAMAFLKSTEKSHLRQAKTRQQKQVVNEVAKARASLFSEISEAADSILEIQPELGLTEKDLVRNEVEEAPDEDSEHRVLQMLRGAPAIHTKEEDYNTCLPYIPPNQATLKGMRSMLLEHRLLIDKARSYFNPEELKLKLYQLKKVGPNPFMGVLNAIGKTETLERKWERKGDDGCVSREVADQRMWEIRNSRAYKQLKARFQAVFTWPALVSTIQVPKGDHLPKSLQCPQQPKRVKKVKEPIRTLFDDLPLPSNEASSKDGLIGTPAQSLNSVISTPQINPATQIGDTSTQNSGVSKQKVVVTPQTSGVSMQNGHVNITTDEVSELPEEEAVEKLVDKILEQYEQRRRRQKRKPPPVKYRRNLTEKKKQSYIEKERTKVLKRLGLYEKMQEYKRQRLEAEQKSSVSAGSTPTATIGSKEAGVTDEAQTDDVNVENVATESGKSAAVNVAEVAKTSDTSGMNLSVNLAENKDVSSIKTVTAGSAASTVANNSEGCQAELESDHEQDMTQPEETKPPIRKRGRPVGSKNKPYSGPLREKSERDIARTVKQEDDFVSPKKKKRKTTARAGSQYKFVRKLVPKLGNITSNISELPILNEPLPQEPVKPPKPPKPVKPPRERKRVSKSKLKKDFNFAKYYFDEKTKRPKKLGTTHKVDKIYRNLGIKIENVENDDDPELKEQGNNGGQRSKVVAALKKKVQTASEAKKVITSRMRKKMSDVKAEKTSANNPMKENARNVANGDVDTSAVNQSQTGTYSADSLSSRSLSSSAETGNAAGGKPSAPSQPQPVMIAIPVFIGNEQQVACVPFYPDEQGMITLPSGKKINVNAAQPQNQKAEGGVSVPVLKLPASAVTQETSKAKSN